MKFGQNVFIYGSSMRNSCSARAAQSKEDSPWSSPRLNPFVITAADGDVADYHHQPFVQCCSFPKMACPVSTSLTYGSLRHYWRPVGPGHRKNMTNGAILDATKIFTVPVRVFLRVPFAGCYGVWYAKMVHHRHISRATSEKGLFN